MSKYNLLNFEEQQRAVRRDLDAEIKRLKALCARAADALEGYTGHYKLIQELRKAESE